MWKSKMRKSMIVIAALGVFGCLAVNLSGAEPGNKGNRMKAKVHDTGAGKYVQDPQGKRPMPVVAIDNVTAWPNLTQLRDGSIIATIHNQPSHLLKPADVDCWASKDGGRSWVKQGTPAPRDNKKAARGQLAAGLAKNGDLIVITAGWSLTGGTGPMGRGVIVPTWVSRSPDGGKTWKIDKKTFPTRPDGVHAIPFGDIVTGANGDLLVATYVSKAAGAQSDRTYFYRSRDDGFTWGDPVALPQWCPGCECSGKLDR